MVAAMADQWAYARVVPWAAPKAGAKVDKKAALQAARKVAPMAGN